MKILTNQIYPILFISFLSMQILQAQNVGVNTESPEAPLHVRSSGQVQTPGGLVLFGDRSEGHMELDFNKLQSLFGNGGTPLPLLLQQAGGDVGIGTLSPNARLDISGAGHQYLNIHDTQAGSSLSGIRLLRGNEFSGTDWRIVNSGGTLRFYDGSDNFETEGDLNFYMGQSGFLGLGTDSPQSHMHVAGSGDQNISVQTTSNGSFSSGIELLRGNEFSATDWKIMNDGGVLKFMEGVDNFDTDGEENVRITQSGFMGVGQISPEAKLHVTGTTSMNATSGGDYLKVGSATGTYLAMDANEIGVRNSSDEPSTLYLQYWGGNLSLAQNDDGRIGVGTSFPQAKLHITDGADVNINGGGELLLGSTSDLNMALDGNEIQARNSGVASQLVLQQGGGNINMIPGENGQVSIGVASAINLPDPEYLLAVDGKIISEEVRVELSGMWPDYVFKEEYQLMSLEKLETQIQSLGHLPGIPSAKNVEDEGFELGDMQKRMMEKIEELTLYMIEANKEIKRLNAEVANLKK